MKPRKAGCTVTIYTFADTNDVDAEYRHGERQRRPLRPDRQHRRLRAVHQARCHNPSSPARGICKDARCSRCP